MSPSSRTKIREGLDTVVCITDQHRKMIVQVLGEFNIGLDYDLSIIKAKQALFDMTINIIEKLML